MLSIAYYGKRWLLFDLCDPNLMVIEIEADVSYSTMVYDSYKLFGIQKSS